MHAVAAKKATEKRKKRRVRRLEAIRNSRKRERLRVEKEGETFAERMEGFASGKLSRRSAAHTAQAMRVMIADDLDSPTGSDYADDSPD
jgi:hypothetical protein